MAVDRLGLPPSELGITRSPAPNISAHLTRLRQAGIITSRTQGRAVYYRLTQPELADLLQAARQLLAPPGRTPPKKRTERREKPSGQIDKKPAAPQLTAGSEDIKHENLQLL
jgi:hypothetical protein